MCCVGKVNMPAREIRDLASMTTRKAKEHLPQRRTALVCRPAQDAQARIHLLAVIVCFLCLFSKVACRTRPANVNKAVGPQKPAGCGLSSTHVAYEGTSIAPFFEARSHPLRRALSARGPAILGGTAVVLIGLPLCGRFTVALASSFTRSGQLCAGWDSDGVLGACT